MRSRMFRATAPTSLPVLIWPQYRPTQHNARPYGHILWITSGQARSDASGLPLKSLKRLVVDHRGQ
jgi:hypothetical protein